MRLKWDFGLGKELGLVFWALTLFEGAFGSWVTIWPLWVEHLGASIGTVGIMLSLGGIIRPFVLLGGTWLSDRVDTRWLLTISRLLLVAGVTFAAFAKSWEYLLITVVFYSFGELVFPALHAHIPVHANGDVGRAFSITCTIGPSAALIVTPIIASWVISKFGMQGGLLMSATLSAIGAIFLTQMDFSEDRAFATSTKPGSVRDVFRHIATRDIVLIHAVTVFSLGVGSMLLPIFLKDVRDLSPATISLLSTGAAIGTMLFGFAGLKLPAAKRSPFLAAAWSIVATALAYVLYATSPWLPMIALAFVFRGGFFATWSFLLGAIGEHAPQRLQTRAFAIVEILGGGAMSFSPLAAAWLYGFNATLPFIVGAIGASIMATVVVWRSGRGFEQELIESDAISAAGIAAS